MPLTCEYLEKQNAAGKIPGGYFKRESRPGPWEVLNARLMDRPMRPLFPKHWRCEIQLIATVLSFDHVNDPAVCALVGASTATSEPYVFWSARAVTARSSDMAGILRSPRLGRPGCLAV